jgi:hypothetical protein
MIIMIGATIYHIRRDEGSSALITALLLLLATLVAYTRWRVKPIPSRTAA